MILRRILIVSLAVLLVVALAWRLPAQPGNNSQLKQQQKEAEKAAKEMEKAHRERSGATPDKPRQLPTDPKLQTLYSDFVENTLKLAQDYEKANNLDSARICYEEILHLVPNSPLAKQKLDEILQREAGAQKRKFDVYASKDWQDTGLVTIVGKPVMINATGTWTFTISYTIGPDGVPIPAELRDFNLGALIGVIDTGNPKDFKPFVLGSSTKFIAKQNGKLLVRIYDSEVKDNSGRLQLDISGTFAKEK